MKLIEKAMVGLVFIQFTAAFIGLFAKWKLVEIEKEKPKLYQKHRKGLDKMREKGEISYEQWDKMRWELIKKHFLQ